MSDEDTLDVMPVPTRNSTRRPEPSFPSTDGKETGWLNMTPQPSLHFIFLRGLPLSNASAKLPEADFLFFCSLPDMNIYFEANSYI